MSRSPALASFYDCARTALLAQAADQPLAIAATGRIFDALAAQRGRVSQTQPVTIPACRHFDEALSNARSGPPPIADLANAFGTLFPELVWAQRQGAERVGEPFLGGHANTLIAGKGGIEERDDVIVGASLVAPGINYPEHKHAPEEMYIALSEGDWYNEEAQWYTPGVGGIVYHRPWLRHAMRSTGLPLLAVWCLHVAENER